MSDLSKYIYLLYSLFLSLDLHLQSGPADISQHYIDMATAMSATLMRKI